MANPPDTFQGLGHPEGYDYEAGSPHLLHRSLRNWVIDSLRQLVSEQFARGGRVRVLEVGAGHGTFTDHLLAAGAHVTLTEMSPSSYELLSHRYRDNRYARVVFDQAGDAAAGMDESFDLVVCISVLHHIPDYLAAIRMWADVTAPGGALATFQDPLWYPRRARLNLMADRGAYFLWRLGQGSLVEGLNTRARRLRRIYDETNPHDMVEYHVVRKGCDEEAIRTVLTEYYDSVALTPYWSTQSRALQKVGDKTRVKTTFAVVARNRKDSFSPTYGRSG